MFMMLYDFFVVIKYFYSSRVMSCATSWYLVFLCVIVFVNVGLMYGMLGMLNVSLKLCRMYGVDDVGCML